MLLETNWSTCILWALQLANCFSLQHAASTMAHLMTEKGQDHCVILNAWGHFITLLGKVSPQLAS